MQRPQVRTIVAMVLLSVTGPLGAADEEAALWVDNVLSVPYPPL
jgi:hypothetical protein